MIYLLNNNMNKKGFTLSELLIAAFVLVFVLILLLGVIVGYITTTHTINNFTIASNHARLVIEEMRSAATGENWLSDVTGEDWSLWAENNGCVTLTQEQVAVTYPDPLAEPLEATISVSWVDFRRSKTFSLTTLFLGR